MLLLSMTIDPYLFWLALSKFCESYWLIGFILWLCNSYIRISMYLSNLGQSKITWIRLMNIFINVISLTRKWLSSNWILISPLTRFTILSSSLSCHPRDLAQSGVIRFCKFSAHLLSQFFLKGSLVLCFTSKWGLGREILSALFCWCWLLVFL
jgi:hypothetical protein